MACLVAESQWLTSSFRKGLFSVQFKDTVHHGGEVTGAGVECSRSHGTHTQEADINECLCQLALFLLCSWRPQPMDGTKCKVDLPVSVKLV